ncbi:MAG: class I SAM-dependent methyltransferase, partial [Clostridium sp.]
MDEIRNVIDELLNDDIIKLVISNKMNSTIEYNKIIINLKEKACKNNCMEEFYQIEKFTDKQVFHENVKPTEIKNKLIELLNNSYKQIQGWSKSNVFDIKISKKGKIHISKKASNNEKIEKKSHNKEKNYILKEGTIIEPLIDLGIFTREGKIVNSKYDKFKQINR